MMLKSDDDKALEEMARKIQKQDKRLSWATALERAKRARRLFNSR